MKKNQIALLCLTAVIMLAVWYVKSPLNNKPSDGDIAVLNEPTSRLAALTQMRDAIRDERNIETSKLDAVIASSTSTLNEKNNALYDKETLSDLTETEVLLELSIINLGYTDAFVHKTTQGVDVIVIADDLSASEVLDIMECVNTRFDDNSIAVSFHPASYYTK